MSAHWNIKSILDSPPSANRIQDILEILLAHRQLTHPTEQTKFLNPPYPTPKLALKSLPDLDQSQLDKAIIHLRQAIQSQQPIIIYGDYDCDGVSATATLWTTLHQQGAHVLPFIPHRLRHGYGLSPLGIQEALTLFPRKNPLIITVDTGISSFAAATKLQKQGLDLIITDHHSPPPQLPPARSIVHTTHLSGSGIAWMIASLLDPKAPLEFATLGTVCDLLPLTGFNRSLVKHGLNSLKNTTNPGLKALYSIAGLADPSLISTYHLGYIIGPRINAVGRLDHALDALRLFCTTNQSTASSLAQKLTELNLQRQDLTRDHADQAIDYFKQLSPLPNVLTIAQPEYHEGVIGLVASRLTDFFHRPSIVISSTDNQLKASARSIPGINITNIISQVHTHLTSYGGHEQAAGFSAPSTALQNIISAIDQLAKNLDPRLLIKTLDIDLQLKPEDLTFDLLDALNRLEPYGIANPQPVFSTALTIQSHSLIGRTKTHLKLHLDQPFNHLDVIGFNLASKAKHLTASSALAFSLQKNTFQGHSRLQLLLKDLKPA